MAVSFSSEARQCFDAVAKQFGLSCVALTEWVVRYESDNVFLEIHFDNRRSYELGVAVGQRTPTPERSFSLAEVLRLKGVDDAATIDGMMVSDTSRLPDALSQLAGLTSMYASDFLLGSDFAFAQLAQLRGKESKAYALERDLRIARAKSETAWLGKDYKAVIDALSPMEQHLSPAEKNRLDYSRNRSAP